MTLTKMGPVEMWYKIVPVQVVGFARGDIFDGDSLSLKEAKGSNSEGHRVLLTRVGLQGSNNEFGVQADNNRWVTGSRGLAVLNMGNPEEVVNLTLR